MGRWGTWDTASEEAAGQPEQAARIGQALQVAAGVVAELLLDLGRPDVGRVRGDVGDNLRGAVADPSARPGLACAGRGLVEVRAVEAPGVPVSVSAYSPSGTSRPVTLSSPLVSCRERVSTITVSAAPASPWVPETESTKSSAVALRSWWLVSSVIPGWSSAIRFIAVPTR